MKRQSALILAGLVLAGLVFALCIAPIPYGTVNAEGKTLLEKSKPAGQPIHRASAPAPQTRHTAPQTPRMNRPEPLPLSRDPAFDRHVDLRQLGQALRELDSAGLADAALQLAEAERILQRSHKCGITARDVQQKAATLATRKRDKDTLDRLSRAAEKAGDKEFLSQLTNARKLADASREANPALRVSVDEMKPGTFARFKDLCNHICRAELLEDAEETGIAAFRLSMSKDLPALQKEHLQRQLAKVREGLPKKRSANSIVLAKLASASRDLPYQTWTTTFTDQSQNHVHAKVSLQGDSGAYFYGGNTGTLSNLTIDTFPPPHIKLGPGVPLTKKDLFGYWQASGSSGWFYWGIVARGQFRGSWGYGDFGTQPQGSWNGHKDNGSGGPVGGGGNSGGSGWPINPTNGPVSPGGGWGSNGNWGGTGGWGGNGGWGPVGP